MKRTFFERRGPDARINLSSNELIHPAVERLLDAVAREITPGLLRQYPRSRAVVDALSAYLHCDGDEFLVTPGSDTALRLVCGYFARRTGGRGEVILQQPNYPAWTETAALHGLPLRPVPTTGLDQDAQARALIEAAAGSSGALIAVSAPNGPIGGRLTGEQLDRLAELANERGHLLVIDSCYQVFDGPLTAQLERRGANVLVIQSLSKSHALAGARVAVLCGPTALLAQLAAVPLEHAVSAPALVALTVAIDQHDQFAAIWRELREVRTEAADRLRSWGLPVAPSGGNFLSVQLPSADAAARAAGALSRAGYRVRDLSGLTGLAGWLRFTIADTATTGRFLPVLGSVLEQVR
ncbi:aminotransferase class I/II-fold pyridoxal phosphate-dependent enzyme [Kitasatospora sp. NBC_01250]|uniref:aminotransferase class I/II-fold pyridoxal phosphate-dependent enzyme n=1 Tax=Kitasatospora sp. NBC_01250 TaxID=2903571 RepID=UPI002E2F9CD1|nr:aminotransferase class I/II-fold pyridoxal phosphate-dependent enzyme [Kitasatospora sp. NBC_01250]